MSRTYRNTKIKHGKPKHHTSKFTQHQENVKFTKPPKRQNSGRIRKEYTTVTVYSRYDCPVADRIYVSKGTPLAITEYASRYDLYPTDRYYLLPPPKTVTRVWKQRVYPRYQYEQDWRDIWDHTWVFKHVHKNKTGARGSNAGISSKKRKVRKIRREGKVTLSMMDAEFPNELRSDVLNQEHEPESYILDCWDQWEREYWEDCDNGLWDDPYENSYFDDDYIEDDDPYDDYIYDDWDYRDYD